MIRRKIETIRVELDRDSGNICTLTYRLLVRAIDDALACADDLHAEITELKEKLVIMRQERDEYKRQLDELRHDSA